MKLRYILLVIILCSSFLFISSQSDDNSSPLLYYYSIEDKAFIIESGDLQFRDVLVEFDLENSNLVVVGPGWSSTSIWFTWYTTILGGAGGNNLHLFNHESSTSYSIGDICPIENLDWSNIGNYLLIDCATSEFLIFDADTQSIIFTLENTQLQINEVLEWIPESNLLAFYHPSNINGEEYVMDIYRIDGQLLLSKQFPSGINDNFHQIWTEHSSSENVIAQLKDTNVALSPSTRFFAFTGSDCGNGICILDNDTGNATSIQFIPEDTETFASASEIYWHVDSSWLIMAGNPIGAFRWLNVTDITGNYTRSLTECSLTSSCFGWMPVSDFQN